MSVNRTPAVDNPRVVPVKIATGQFLHFILDAGGPGPIFSFASDVKGTLFQAADFPGHPKLRYEWDHLKNPSDTHQQEVLVLGLLFLTNEKYTYTVKLCNGEGVMSTVMQIEYTGAPTDPANESFTVGVV